jgi:hypothetical protein
MGVGDTGHYLKVLHIKTGWLADTGQDGLLRACGAVHVESNLDHPRQDPLDLFLCGFVLHGYNHFLFRFVVG